MSERERNGRAGGSCQIGERFPACTWNTGQLQGQLMELCRAGGAPSGAGSACLAREELL